MTASRGPAAEGVGDLDACSRLTQWVASLVGARFASLLANKDSPPAKIRASLTSDMAAGHCPGPAYSIALIRTRAHQLCPLASLHRRASCAVPRYPNSHSLCFHFFGSNSASLPLSISWTMTLADSPGRVCKGSQRGSVTSPRRAGHAGPWNALTQTPPLLPELRLSPGAFFTPNHHLNLLPRLLDPTDPPSQRDVFLLACPDARLDAPAPRFPLPLRPVLFSLSLAYPFLSLPFLDLRPDLHPPRLLPTPCLSSRPTALPRRHPQLRSLNERGSPPRVQRHWRQRDSGSGAGGAGA